MIYAKNPTFLQNDFSGQKPLLTKNSNRPKGSANHPRIIIYVCMYGLMTTPTLIKEFLTYPTPSSVRAVHQAMSLRRDCPNPRPDRIVRLTSILWMCAPSMCVTPPIGHMYNCVYDLYVPRALHLVRRGRGVGHRLRSARRDPGYLGPGQGGSWAGVQRRTQPTE
jgi:hypothetical protein